MIKALPRVRSLSYFGEALEGGMRVRLTEDLRSLFGFCGGVYNETMVTKRFFLRKNTDGTWSIVDIFTDLPVIVDNQVMIEMEKREADGFVDLLNSIDLQRRRIFGDCQEFRVWAGIMGSKEITHAPSQRTQYS